MSKVSKKSKPKIRRVMIHDYLFSLTWLVQRGGTKQQASNWYGRKIKHEPMVCPVNGAIGSFLCRNGERDSLIWLSEDAGAGTIVHETMHAMIRLAEIIDIKISDQSEELYAHYQDWLYREIVRRLYA